MTLVWNVFDYVEHSKTWTAFKTEEICLEANSSTLSLTLVQVSWRLWRLPSIKFVLYIRPLICSKYVVSVLRSEVPAAVMRRVTTGLHSEECVVRRFRRCANGTERTYTNLDSTL